jgi:hypothetical protein
MVRKAHTSKKNNRKRGVTKRRKVRGGNVYATTMRAQRTMEHIVTDVNAVVAQLAELSAELQRQVQPGHPNVNLVALAQAENRQARQQYDPGHVNQNANQNANQNGPGEQPNDPIGVWNHPNNGHARIWRFQGHRYARLGNEIYEVDDNGNVGDWIGVYIAAENRINRNLPEPEYIND